MEVVIPGGFDLFHRDHREFIKQGVRLAANHSPIDTISIALGSNEYLHSKGKYRPYFDYDWRKDDMHRFLQESFPGFRTNVFRMQLQEFLETAGDRGEIVVVSEEHKNKQFRNWQNVIHMPPLNQIHTTDIERLLLSTKENSQCLIRQVGAALLRDGELVTAVKNGPHEDNGCRSCPKYVDIMNTFALTGIKKASPIPCAHSHAEETAVILAQPGDHLVTTTAPCSSCAEKVIKAQVQRLVFMEDYHDRRPLYELEAAGVQVRQAGL
jgi:deoxycytidylate deaminase/phosphopantetheine adenylyltransferase